MTALLLLLVPIVIVDAANPVLFAAVMYTLGTRQPFGSSLAMLLGYFVTYFAAGVVLAVGLDAIVDYLANPRPVDYVIQIVVGIVLAVAGYWMRTPNRPAPKRTFDKPSALGPGMALVFGLQVNAIGLPFALPYFGALSQILKADLAVLPALLALLYYNLLYILPFVALVGIRWVFRAQSEPIFARLSILVDRVSDVVMPILVLLLGAVLLADGVGFFVGHPLIPTDLLSGPRTDNAP